MATPLTNLQHRMALLEAQFQAAGIVGTLVHQAGQIPGMTEDFTSDILSLQSDTATLATTANGAAQKANNLSDISSRHTSRKNLGVNCVTVTDYGAVGDAVYLDQRVSSGTFGLAGSTPTDVTTYGMCFKNSGFTVPATDNTTAFQTAWDALMSASAFSLTTRAVNVGLNSQREELYIPAGSYYISNASSLFSLARTTPLGSQAGIRIRGDGQNNTYLFVRITGTGSTDYLFYDDNDFVGMEIEGLTIVACTGTERFFYQSSAGTGKRWMLTKVTSADYLTFLTIEGTANADRWVFNNCLWNTNVAGATLHLNHTNSQAVGFDYYSPSITHMQGGNIFDISKSGLTRVFGGSGEIYGLHSDGADGRLVSITGTSISDQTTPVITFSDFKLEMHQDAGLIDSTIGVAIFRGCNVLPLSNTRIANGIKEHVVMRNRGQMIFDGGVFGDIKVATSTSMTLDYNSGDKAGILIKDALVKNINLISSNANFYTDATDGLTTTIASQTGTGSGVGMGHLQVEGCRSYGESYSVPPIITAVNGSPFGTQAWFPRPCKSHKVVHKMSNAIQFGLYDENHTAQIVLPLNCELIRVGIVKQSNQSGIGTDSRTWVLKDGNGTTLATLTTTGTTSWVSAISADQYRVMRSTNDRTLTISCNAATPSSVGTGAEGYFFAEYI